MLVTGAASGMGAALCTRLTGQGVRVIGMDRDRDGLERMVGAGDCADVIEIDLSDRSAIESTLGGVRADGVANVAGVGPDLDDPALIFRINLLAPLIVLETLRPSLAPGAVVVNVSSITGEMADGGFDQQLADPLVDGFIERITRSIDDAPGAYTYSKRALIGETLRRAVIWAPEVRINCVSPGIVDTPLGERSKAFAWTNKASQRIPLGRTGLPEEVAEVIAFLLSPASSYMVASTLIVDGGYVASQRARRARQGLPDTGTLRPE
jgi:NAD(P)-dependent dehydrogenase (short-subunit alcohol dehydrogenase family)